MSKSEDTPTNDPVSALPDDEGGPHMITSLEEVARLLEGSRQTMD